MLGYMAERYQINLEGVVDSAPHFERSEHRFYIPFKIGKITTAPRRDDITDEEEIKRYKSLIDRVSDETKTLISSYPLPIIMGSRLIVNISSYEIEMRLKGDSLGGFVPSNIHLLDSTGEIIVSY